MQKAKKFHVFTSYSLLFTAYCFLLTPYSLLLTVEPAHAARIKEVANFEGIRSNPLIGYGLVVGLDGTGDKSGTEFTVQSLVNMLNRFGIKVSPSAVKVKNVAAVIVTAEMSPVKRAGDRIDIILSSIGDAKSLQGGTLLFTPLRGADNSIYVVAQGPVSTGGFIGGGEAGTSVQKNHSVVGRVPGGGFIEKEIPIQLSDDLSLILSQPDFTTSNKIAQKINNTLGTGIAMPLDGTKIKLKIPDEYKTTGRFVEFLSRVEGLDVPVDAVSRVIVNERTGTIVIGENVRLSTIAVSHGNLSVEIKTKQVVSQPPPFSSGSTVTVPEEEVTIKEEKARLILLEHGATLGDVVRALNAIGVTPRDLISILQAIKASGALQSELEII
ncbi:MAG: flagellar basal body P-ring protein FlgI [Deltaproteobacteria bacterium]|nr:flagellar basal body P-ring protein FlgI [Deltaproteobacteria bacterium]